MYIKKLRLMARHAVTMGLGRPFVKPSNSMIFVARIIGLASLVAFNLAYATPFDCEHRCGVELEGAYPHLIVGTVDGVADSEKSAALFHAMRNENRWAALPSSPDNFRRQVQPVSIRLPSGRSYTVLITQEEAQSAPIKSGDFVRYSPHRGVNEKPPSEASDVVAYWRATGCVAVLCRAGDSACISGYRSGIYQATDGVALTADGKHTAPDAPSVDPHSMRPR